MNADGSGLHNLSDGYNAGHVHFAAWSPDGNRIAYIADTDSASQIRVVDADGTNDKPLANIVRTAGHDGKLHSPAWSPDGNRIAFIADMGGLSQIHVVDADGTNDKWLASMPCSDELPKWSSDGRFIAFCVEDGKYFDIHIVGLDGTGDRNLTGTHAFTTGGTMINGHYFHAFWWFDDNKKILVAPTDSIMGGDRKLYTIDVATSTVIRIGEIPDAIDAESPSGKIVAFTLQANISDLYTMKIDGTDIRCIRRGFNARPSLTPTVSSSYFGQIVEAVGRFAWLALTVRTSTS